MKTKKPPQIEPVETDAADSATVDAFQEIMRHDLAMDQIHAREGLVENCPHCKVHRGHKAGCPALLTSEEREQLAKVKGDIDAHRAELYSIENYRKFLR